MQETLFLVFVAGLILGFLYFRALWMTVCRLPVTLKPLRLFIMSFIIRLALLLICFYFLMGGYAERLVAVLAGFVAAREICKRLWGKTMKIDNRPVAAKSG